MGSIEKPLSTTSGPGCLSKTYTVQTLQHHIVRRSQVWVGMTPQSVNVKSYPAVNLCLLLCEDLSTQKLLLTPKLGHTKATQQRKLTRVTPAKFHWRMETTRGQANGTGVKRTASLCAHERAGVCYWVHLSTPGNNLTLFPFRLESHPAQSTRHIHTHTPNPTLTHTHDAFMHARILASVTPCSQPPAHKQPLLFAFLSL